MAVNNLVHKRNRATEDTTREPSPVIWAQSRVAEIRENPNIGIHYYDDFTDLPLAPTLTTQIAFGKYKAFGDTGVTISKISLVNSVEIAGGCLEIAIDSDNDAGILCQAYPSFRLSGSKATSGKLLFECCVAQSSIATNMLDWFVGLAEVEQFTLASTTIAGGGVIENSGSMIGFRIEEDGLGVIDTVRSDRATSFTNIGDTEGGTLVANTFQRLGFVYDPEETDRCVVFYENGQELTTKLTRAALVALTNLDANGLGLFIGAAGDSGVAGSVYMKWWQCEQIFPVGT